VNYFKPGDFRFSFFGFVISLSYAFSGLDFCGFFFRMRRWRNWWWWWLCCCWWCLDL